MYFMIEAQTKVSEIVHYRKKKTIRFQWSSNIHTEENARTEMKYDVCCVTLTSLADKTVTPPTAVQSLADQPDRCL